MLSDASKWLMNVVGCVSSASTRFEMNAGGGWAAVGKNTGDLVVVLWCSGFSSMAIVFCCSSVMYYRLVM